MLLIMICCIALLLFAAVASANKTLDTYDFATTAIHVLGPCFVFGVAWLSLKTAHHMLYVEALGESAFIDPLTGVANRRRFDECLTEEIGRAKATGQPLSLLIIDIDHFKQVNDSFGHGIGDLVLKQLATVAVSEIRHTDTVCRIGGEEFVVIMPGLERAFAIASADRLRRAIAKAHLPLKEGGEIRTTVSLGLAMLHDDENSDDLLFRADAALYDAKRSGRDRLCAVA